MRNSFFNKLSFFSLAFLCATTALPLFADSAPRDEVKESLLALKVRTKLLNHMHSAATPIKVSAEAQTITLSGEVTKQPDRDLAENVAAPATGATHGKK